MAEFHGGVGAGGFLAASRAVVRLSRSAAVRFGDWSNSAAAPSPIFRLAASRLEVSNDNREPTWSKAAECSNARSFTHAANVIPSGSGGLIDTVMKWMESTLRSLRDFRRDLFGGFPCPLVGSVGSRMRQTHRAKASRSGGIRPPMPMASQ